jgi:hypothetical protein
MGDTDDQDTKKGKAESGSTKKKFDKAKKNAKRAIKKQKSRNQTRHINILLRAIIEAYPHDDQTVTNEQRLATAKKALFGVAPTSGRTVIDDELALFFMHKRVEKSKLDTLRRSIKRFQSPDAQAEIQRKIDKDPSSIRAAAKDWLKTNEGRKNVDPRSEIDRLRRKYEAWKPSASDLADIAEVSHHGELQGIEAYWVKVMSNMFEDLKTLGISSKPPWDETTTVKSQADDD